MKGIRILLFTWFMSVVCITNVFAGNAGLFRLPFDPNQRWSACAEIGFRDVPPGGQTFMNLNTDLDPDKYHLAEDWNGKCGGSTDLGAVLYAAADGVIKYLRDVSINDSMGKFLLLSHTLPDGSQRDIMYEHILNIETNPRTGAKYKIGDVVYIGETIARLGDANGFYAGAAHLHFEMRRDTAMSTTVNPYYQTLSVSTALKYSSPSLFIDDRSTAVVQNLVSGQRVEFLQSQNAPSSTAFIEYNGERNSLKRAADQGWISNQVYVQINGAWYVYNSITSVFFGAGNTYSILANVPGAKLYILVPGHNYKKDRAQIDMLQAASADTRFKSVTPDIYSENLGWDPNYELRAMRFNYTSTSGSGVSYFNHATNKTNPLLRFTTYYDPDKKVWTNWVQVNVNTLD
jgi:hypothetical protein